MIIVKNGAVLKSRECKGEIATAEEFNRIKGIVVTGCYDLSDTITIPDENWRPENWIKGGGYDSSQIIGAVAKAAFEAGATVMLRALQAGGQP